MKKNFGFIPTLITDKTVKYQAPKTMPIPSKYSYQQFLSPVTNQGSNPYCIPHSVATWINWKENIKTGSKADNNVRYEDIYYSKESVGEGMTYQEAFDYLKDNGVKTNKGVKKITQAGYITTVAFLKAALLANGPCFGALPVYDSTSEQFWKKGQTLEGWHSITIVGWNEKGWIIRNSWGTSFGNGGYTVLPYSDEKCFREIWTIFG